MCFKSIGKAHRLVNQAYETLQAIESACINNRHAVLKILYHPHRNFYEPLRVGLAENLNKTRLIFDGCFQLGERTLEPGAYTLRLEGEAIALIDEQGCIIERSSELQFVPVEKTVCTFTLPENSIGRDFHWQRNTLQTFRGALSACCFEPNSMTIINHINLEDYLEAVICSEMSPKASEEFLKAHCVISRSWVLAQLQPRTPEKTTAAAAKKYTVANTIDRYIKQFQRKRRFNPC